MGALSIVSLHLVARRERVCDLLQRGAGGGGGHPASLQQQAGSLADPEFFLG